MAELAELTELTEEQCDHLLALAEQASRRAYAPYSQFAVGAAVLSTSGQIFSACNVENASYGLACCAERNAIFQMVAAGQRQLQCVAIYTPTDTPTAPCGACRQVIHEFGPSAQVISGCRTSQCFRTTIDRLLPGAFGPGGFGGSAALGSSRELPNR